jgi:hypothetical protein
MNKLIIPLAVGFVAISLFSPASAQIAVGTPTVTEEARLTSTTAQEANSKEKERKPRDAVASQTVDKNWNSQVWFPLIRLFGIAAIIGVLLWFIDLPKFMDRQAWTDRTIVALILVFSFAAASMIDVDEKALTALKDVTLIVVGFYFGAAKSEGQKETKSVEKTNGAEQPKS